MNRVQSYVFWSTSQARQLVRNVLMKEPKIGMHHQQLFNEIIKQYPDEKLPTHLVPDAPQKPPVRGGAYLKPVPALVDHPVRSMRYLKKVILEDMLRLQEVEKVIVTRDHEEKRTRTKALFVKHPEPVDAAEMYRWRVVPGSTPTDNAPDPDPKEMFETKRVEAWRKKVQEKNKMLPRAQRLSTRHPPPPKRIMWLREREWKDKGLDYDPFALSEGRRDLLSASGYHRSRAPRRPDEDHNTFSSTEDTYEDLEDRKFAELESEPISSVPETGEQDVYDVLFPEDDDFTPYRRSSERRDGYLNQRREFSHAAGQDPETKASENLSIPPFPKFTELEIGEKERERLQSWRDNGVEDKKQQENQHQPPPAASISQNDGPQINFLERGLHSSVYVRPSKPRVPHREPEPERNEDIQPPRIDTRLEDDSHPTETDRESTLGAEITFLQAEPYERSRRPRGPPKEPEPECWDRDLPEDILPPPIDTQKDAPRPMADLKMHVSPTVGVRHSRATRLYESLVRKSLTGPYAVPRLIIERDRPSYLVSRGCVSLCLVMNVYSGLRFDVSHRREGRRI
ncbi:hypothetical protein EDD85DRAFT_842349 [Armillaria nabsnona]|nr:hypothetical protein EDD85DRAFT_842349 [Armillaria nabsnona]